MTLYGDVLLLIFLFQISCMKVFESSTYDSAVSFCRLCNFNAVWSKFLYVGGKNDNTKDS